MQWWLSHLLCCLSCDIPDSTLLPQWSKGNQQRLPSGCEAQILVPSYQCDDCGHGDWERWARLLKAEHIIDNLFTKEVSHVTFATWVWVALPAAVAPVLRTLRCPPCRGRLQTSIMAYKHLD